MFLTRSGFFLLFTNCLCFKYRSQDSANLGSTDIKVIRIFPSREKRSGLFFDLFPAAIKMHLSVNQSAITLDLHRNDRIASDVPIYVMRDAKIVKHESNTQKMMSFYQDCISGAAVEVECLPIKDKSCRYLVKGSFIFQNRLIIVEPEDKKYSRERVEHVPLAVGDINFGKTNVVEDESDAGTAENNEIVHHQLYEFNNSVEYVTDYIVPDRDERSKLKLKNERITSTHKLSKRAVVSHQVEFLSVTDYPIYQTWYDDSEASNADDKHSDALDKLREFYALLLNAVDLRYQTIISSSISIEIVYAGIFISDSADISTWTESIKTTASPRDQVDASDALSNFKSWLSTQTGLPDYDHAMAFTGYDLTSDGSPSNAGLAWVGGTCDHTSPYANSISEEHFEASSAIVAAHELSHNLGALHDGDGNTCSADDSYVMAPSSGGVTDSRAQNQWIFSNCSVDYMETYIEKLNTESNNCLLSTGSTYNATALDQHDDSKLGQIYDADTQCEKIKGNGSYVCRSQYTDYTELCWVLWCDNLDDNTCGTTIAWEGTTCGNNKWCISGHCVSDAQAPSSSDTCPLGDQPGVIVGSTTCATMSSQNCYGTGWPETCCAACESYYTGTKDCEYGDKASGCNVASCPGYSDETISQCCSTCSAFTTTTIATGTTTTSTTTTIATGTTTTSTTTTIATGTTTTSTTTTNAPGTTTTSTTTTNAPGTTTTAGTGTASTSQVPDTESEALNVYVISAIAGSAAVVTVATVVTVVIIVVKVKASAGVAPIAQVAPFRA